jgi:hypothetical protein
MNRTEQARALLRQWEDARVENFYDDEVLRATLALHLGADRLATIEPALQSAGAAASGPIAQACALLERPECLPRLERWNAVGDRIEDVIYHPAHHGAGRLVWGSGILSVLREPGSAVPHGALNYLFAMNGEGGHLCAVGCTAGLIKAIQRCGTEWMRREWLPRLLERDYDRRWHAAQFLTEVQGGSDVGANACIASPLPAPGMWRITGEKWFCSNVTADLSAVTARPEGAAGGTEGLALFVVPRRLEDGRLNNVFIRRLKNKLGMRSLPTGEVDFQDAVAYQLGELDEGFKVMMGVIINTSRLGVGVVSSAIMRRAYLEAHAYARIRTAFGRRLIEFPPIRRQLAEMRALGIAGLTFSFFVAALEDRLVEAGVAPEEDPLFRSAVTVNKYICATDAARVVRSAMDVLGGNGMIEDFSALPRLYREMPIHETWEGPTNTLMAQLLRDAGRSKLYTIFLDTASDAWLGRRDPAVTVLRDRALRSVAETREALDDLMRRDFNVAALHVSTVAYRMARVFQTSILAEHADRMGNTRPSGMLLASLRFLLTSDQSAGSHLIADDTYPDLIDSLSRA